MSGKSCLKKREQYENRRQAGKNFIPRREQYENRRQAGKNFILAFYENAVYCGSDSCGGSDCNIVYTHDYAGGKKQYPQYLFRLSAGSFHFVWTGDGECHAGKC